MEGCSNKQEIFQFDLFWPKRKPPEPTSLSFWHSCQSSYHDADTLLHERSSNQPRSLACLLLQSEYSALILHRCANVDTTIISLSAKIIFIHYLQLIIIEFDPINHGFCLAILCHTLHFVTQNRLINAKHGFFTSHSLTSPSPFGSARTAPLFSSHIPANPYP